MKSIAKSILELTPTCFGPTVDLAGTKPGAAGPVSMVPIGIIGKWRFPMYDLVIVRKWFTWLPIFNLTTDDVLQAIRRISLLGWGLD